MSTEESTSDRDKVVVESILADAVEEIRRSRSDWIMDQLHEARIAQTKITGSWTSAEAAVLTQQYIQEWKADNPGLYGLWCYYELHIRPRPPEEN